ncbi:hypothetical protein L2E82_03481 [Cichorium intybus]|uniref:Uncharacterized protein n=1 Tax=Cichorium intybus TaxID=13427 RepID=A0ACB9H3Y0_CICIN|nr:hypothetical protein L2E82_03481 [Cichorium intybus]
MTETMSHQNRPNNDAEWKVVDRRRNNRSETPTSFYVGNIPDGVTVNEIWKKFEDFGKVVDVYIAHKRDGHGGRFGFVKFGGVKDVLVLEQTFGKIFLGHNSLNINLAKFHRKPINPTSQKNFNTTTNHQTSHHPPPPPHPSISAWGLRGSKSFASVVSGHQPGINTKSNPVKICISPDLDKLLFDNFLLGEVTDYETLKALPNMLNDEGVIFGKVFFYSGLCVLIGFDDVVSTTVLSVDEDVWKFTDLSSCEGRILTELTTRINEEITIEFGNGKHLKIGVIELEENLAPFDAGDSWGENNNYINENQNSSDDDCNNEEYDSECDMEGMSDTWNNNDYADREEGEIHVEAQTDANEFAGKSSADIVDLVAEESSAMDDVVSHENSTESPIEREVVEESQLNSIIDKDAGNNNVLKKVFGSLNEVVDEKSLKNQSYQILPPTTDPDTNSVSIDLNRDIPHARTDHGDTNSNNESHASHEIRKTVEVGADLGFEIDADNQILHEVLSGAGVNFIA